VEPTQRPSNPRLTRTGFAAILAGLGLGAAFILLAALGHRFYAAVILGAAIVLWHRSLAHEQRQAVGRELQRRERAPLGRAFKAFDTLVALLLLFVVVLALLKAR